MSCIDAASIGHANGRNDWLSLALLDTFLNSGQLLLLLLLAFGQFELLLLYRGQQGGFLIRWQMRQFAAQAQRRLRVRFAKCVARRVASEQVAPGSSGWSAHWRRNGRTADDKRVGRWSRTHQHVYLG